MLAQLGHAYRDAGRLIEAHDLFVRMREADKYDTHRRFVSNTAFLLGRLEEARQALVEDRRKRNFNQDDVQYLIRLEAAVGQFHRALNVALRFPKDPDFDPRLELAELQVRVGDYRSTVDGCEKYIDSANWEWRDRSRAILGEALINLGEFARAEPLLHDLLAEARAAPTVEYELTALRLLAELHLRARDFDRSRAFLDDLWDLAKRGPYRLILADACIVLSNLERELGRKNEAVAAAEEAYRHTWCDGPPHAYHSGLTRAEQALDTLGAAYPNIPPASAKAPDDATTE